MTLDPIIFILFAFSCLVLGVALVVLIFSYERLLKRLSNVEKENKDISADFYRKQEKIIEDARSIALKIIEEANLTASDMLSKTKNIREKSQETLNKHLELLLAHEKDFIDKNSETLLQDYKDSLQKLREEHIALFKSIATDIEKSAAYEVKDFREILQKETVSSQKIVEQEIENDYKKAQEELIAYKQERIKDIDESIYKLLLSVSKLVLSKALRVEDHEQLVIDSLAKAKEETGIIKKA